MGLIIVRSTFPGVNALGYGKDLFSSLLGERDAGLRQLGESVIARSAPPTVLCPRRI